MSVSLFSRSEAVVRSLERFDKSENSLEGRPRFGGLSAGGADAEEEEEERQDDRRCLIII